MTRLHGVLEGERATAAFAAALAQAIPREFFYIALAGGLGAGKTQTVRSLLRAWGETGVVPSPTYTLLEEYRLADHRLVHMDLYRLASAEELEFLGVRELLGEDLTLVVEWAQRAESALPAPDLVLRLEIVGETARHIEIQAASPRGSACVQRLAEISQHDHRLALLASEAT